MSTLFVITAFPASGKSTLAKDLCQKHNAILLSEDEWMEGICNTYYNEEIKDKIVSFIEHFASKLLIAGTVAVSFLNELKCKAGKRNEFLEPQFPMKIEDLEAAYRKYQVPNIETETFEVVEYQV